MVTTKSAVAGASPARSKPLEAVARAVAAIVRSRVTGASNSDSTTNSEGAERVAHQREPTCAGAERKAVKRGQR